MATVGDLVAQTLVPAFGGIDTASSPSFMDKVKAPLVRNLLVDRPGVLPIRGPIVNHTELSLGTSLIPTGTWQFNNKILVGYMEQSASAKRDPWVAPYRKAAASGDLSLGNTTNMKLVDLDALTVSNVTVTDRHQVIGPGSARIGAYVYGYGYSCNTATNPAVSENGGFLFRRRLLRWDGTTTVPTIYTNAPEGSQAVLAHLNRLWVLGGRDVPGGSPSTIEQNTLYFSRPAGPTTDTAAQWTDPVSGLVNKIVVDSDDQNDFGVGLAKVDQNLVIFKRRSIHVLYGYSPTTFTLRPATMNFGCIDQRSIVETHQGVYFLSDQGYMFYDGTQFTNVSGNELSNSLLSAALTAVGDLGLDGGRAVATKLPNDYILLSICAQTTSSGAQLSTPRFSALLHTPTAAWSLFQSDVLSNPTPIALGRTSLNAWIFDANKVVKADYLTMPEQKPASTGGKDECTVSAATQRARIPAVWQSRLYSLASPLGHSQLHRLLVDYHFAVEGTADDADNGFFVSLIQGNGTPLLFDSGAVSEKQLPAQGHPTTGYLFRRRHVLDIFSECADVQLRIEWKQDSGGDFPAVAKAEIYDCTVEYQPSRQKRAT